MIPYVPAPGAGLAADVPLDRPGDVHQAVADLHRGDAGPHRLLGHPGELDQLRRVPGADEGGVGGVTVPAVDDRAGVDRDDVAVLEDGLLVRDAVDDDLVHRGADGRGEAAVAQEVRLRPVVGDAPCGRPRPDPGWWPRAPPRRGRRVDRGDDQPRLAHLRDLLGGLDLHHALPLRLRRCLRVSRRAQQYGRGALGHRGRTCRLLPSQGCTSFWSASIARSVTSVTSRARGW